MATVCIDPVEGSYVACGGIDGKIHIFKHLERTKQSKKGKEKKDNTLKHLGKAYEFSGHQSLITCSGFMGLQHLVSGSDDSDLMLWDFEKPARYLVKYTDHANEVNCLDVFNRDGNIFASGSADATVHVWDIRMRQPAIRIFDKNDCGITAIKFMPDNVNTLAAGQDDSQIKLLDLRTLGEIANFKDDMNISAISDIQFSKSGRIMFSCSHQSEKIVGWDVLNECQASSFGSDMLLGGIKSIDLADDGMTVVSAGKRGMIVNWNMS